MMRHDRYGNEVSKDVIDAIVDDVLFGDDDREAYLREIEDTIRALRGTNTPPVHRLQQFQPTAIAAALGLIFMAGVLFGWLLTPTRQVREVFNYNYQISRAAAPRLAIDPGVALGIKPLPKLLPLPVRKGGDHE